MTNRIAIMYLGRIVETGPIDEVYNKPAHQYSRALLAAIPIVNLEYKGERLMISGEIASALALPSGCRFQTCCLFTQEICRSMDPARVTVGEEHSAVCHLTCVTFLTCCYNSPVDRSMARVAIKCGKTRIMGSLS